MGKSLTFHIISDLPHGCLSVFMMWQLAYSIRAQVLRIKRDWRNLEYLMNAMV